MKESIMKSNKASVLTVNGASSSLKFALYDVGEPLKRRLHGKPSSRIGLHWDHELGSRFMERSLKGKERRASEPFLDS